VSDVFADTVARLSHVPGVRGAILVEPETGVPITAEVEANVSPQALAALAAALFQRTATASTAAGLGALRRFHLEGAGGHVLMAGAGDLILVVLVEDDGQLGLVRLEAQRAAESLQ
jgi:predicted regulator of Ras-like GTPase activity (Roadblock/LC7/MglB family)